MSDMHPCCTTDHQSRSDRSTVKKSCSRAEIHTQVTDDTQIDVCTQVAAALTIWAIKSSSESTGDV
jgi:hypothetical protein